MLTFFSVKPLGYYIHYNFSEIISGSYIGFILNLCLIIYLNSLR